MSITKLWSSCKLTELWLCNFFLFLALSYGNTITTAINDTVITVLRVVWDISQLSYYSSYCISIFSLLCMHWSRMHVESFTAWPCLKNSVVIDLWLPITVVSSLAVHVWHSWPMLWNTEILPLNVGMVLDSLLYLHQAICMNNIAIRVNLSFWLCSSCLSDFKIAWLQNW